MKFFCLQRCKSARGCGVVQRYKTARLVLQLIVARPATCFGDSATRLDDKGSENVKVVFNGPLPRLMSFNHPEHRALKLHERNALQGSRRSQLNSPNRVIQQNEVGKRKRGFCMGRGGIHTLPLAVQLSSEPSEDIDTPNID